MKLQKKAILIFVVLLIAVLIVVIGFFTTILLASNRALEEQYIEKDLDQAVNKLNDELFSMSSIASDWGPWDDTVDFVNGNDPEYLNSNLQPYGFDNLNMNLIVIANTKGEVLFSGEYDLENKVMVPVHEFFSVQLNLKDPMMNMSDPHHITSGILMLPEAPMLVVSQPIVFSNYSGQPQGVIIMGRYLNKEEIARLAKLTRPSLTFTDIDDPALAPDLVVHIRDKTGSAPGIIQQLNRDQVAGYALIRDIYGNDALVLQITEPRDIYRRGRDTTVQVIIIILAGGLFLGLLVIFLLDRVVLKRMHSLADQVNTIGKSGITRDHVVMEGDDELSGLATEINRMLETIASTLSILESTMESTADGILVADDKGGIVLFNVKFKEMWGIPEAIIVSKDDDAALSFVLDQLKEPEIFIKTVRDLYNAPEKISFDFMELKDGRVFEWYSQPQRIGDSVVGRVWSFRDVTERKRAEDALTELKNRYLTIFDNTGNGTIIIAKDTSIIMANLGWTAITGIPKEDIIGRSWTEFIHPEDLEQMKKHHYERRNDPANVPKEYTFRLIDASKNIHHCLVSVVMIPGTTDSIAALVDISERKRAEDAIELANKKLNLMNNITRHDILNTITGLLGCVDMANATPSQEERIGLLNDIGDLTRIIQRQIVFTREYQEVGVHLPVWQNVNGVITRILPNFEHSGMHILVELENTEIYADPLLEKVFYNLVDNAIRYGETITTIKFYFQISDKGLSIICEDDGAGIPPEEKTQIFERGVGKNTGMGLFLTREILGITGISIEETGVYGKGARFEIRIPMGTFRFKIDDQKNT